MKLEDGPSLLCCWDVGCYCFYYSKNLSKICVVLVLEGHNQVTKLVQKDQFLRLQVLYDYHTTAIRLEWPIRDSVNKITGRRRKSAI